MPVDDAWWETLLAQLHELIDKGEKADVVILLGRKDSWGAPLRPKIHVRRFDVEQTG